MENKSDTKQLSIEAKLALIARECPLVPHTNAGRLFSTVRRMKRESELQIPIELRSGFAISTRAGLPANQLPEAAWNEFFDRQSTELRFSYPELYALLFSK